jgi:hypothetical protein
VSVATVHAQKGATETNSIAPSTCGGLQTAWNYDRQTQFIMLEKTQDRRAPSWGDPTDNNLTDG